jgi:DNA-binding response OmpR family regulator
MSILYFDILGKTTLDLMPFLHYGICVDSNNTNQPNATPTQSGGKKLLIIEDDFYIRDLYALTAKSEGFTVLEAANGWEGVNQARSAHPDAILLDLMLPDLNGLDVLKTIKETPELSHVPIIIATNVADSETEKKARDMGAADYLTKITVSPVEAVEKVKAFLQ